MMNKGSSNKKRQFVIFFVEILLQVAHAANNSVWRWRHICRIARSCSANPVLSTPELSRRLSSSACPGHQDFMDFFDQPRAHWKSVPEPAESMIHRSNIVRNFLDIIQRDTRRLFTFVQKEV